MDLKRYFENASGFGVLATADDMGNVNSAVYSRPHFMDDGTLAFIMNDRLTHHNLKSNPKACYLFREDEKGYKGRRLKLSKIGEEQDSDMLKQLRRRNYSSEKEYETPKYLVFFELTKALPLIGAEV